jgi:hypothetical protein
LSNSHKPKYLQQSTEGTPTGRQPINISNYSKYIDTPSKNNLNVPCNAPFTGISGHTSPITRQQGLYIEVGVSPDEVGPTSDLRHSSVGRQPGSDSRKIARNDLGSLENIRQMINTKGYNKSTGKLVDPQRDDQSPARDLGASNPNTRRRHFMNPGKGGNGTKAMALQTTGKLETIPRGLQDSGVQDAEGYNGYNGKNLNQSVATNNSCILVEQEGKSPVCPRKPKLDFNDRYDSQPLPASKKILVKQNFSETGPTSLKSSKIVLKKKQPFTEAYNQEKDGDPRDQMGRSQSNNFKKVRLSTTLNKEKFKNNEVNNTHESVQTKKG